MKKLFFSAVALVAFSGVGIAKNIDSSLISDFEIDSYRVAKSCMQVYAETYQAFVDLGLEEEAAGEAAAAYGECISGKGYSIEP